MHLREGEAPEGHEGRLRWVDCALINCVLSIQLLLCHVGVKVFVYVYCV